jgi:putative PIN family toxin of toxin-antitoxin system
VVFDTNVYVSFLLGKRVTEMLQKHLQDHRVIIVSTTRQIEELVDVLSRSHISKRLDSRKVSDLLSAVSSSSEQAAPSLGLRLCRDAADDYLLDVAASAKAAFLVTGDKDLLDDLALKQKMLTDYGVEVITTSEFLMKL